MPFLSETFHMRRLAESQVHIKTTYIVGNRLVSRNTDGTQNEDVINGIRCRKEYYVQGIPTYVEKLFDSRIEYTYVSDTMNETPYTCSNCGYSGRVKDFADGCPCCEAASNLVYTDKDLGGKYHYDLVLKKPLYRVVTGIVDCIISLALSFLFIVNTSRTFNGYDVKCPGCNANIDATEGVCAYCGTRLGYIQEWAMEKA